VPTTWDETLVLSGEPGQYILVARRKGADWFLGAITDWTPRILAVPLNFLAPGDYQVETWSDVTGDDNPNHLAHQQQQLNQADTLTLNLNSGGGEVVHIQHRK